MSIAKMARIVVHQSSGSVPAQFRAALTFGAGPTPTGLLSMVVSYVPAEVALPYITVASGMAALEELSRGLWSPRFWVAVAFTVVSSVTVWAAAKKTSDKTAEAAGIPRANWPGGGTVLRKGLYEILVGGGIGFFTWAAAMPDSWINWGKNFFWAPAALVAIVALLIGKFAIILGRNL